MRDDGRRRHAVLPLRDKPRLVMDSRLDPRSPCEQAKPSGWECDAAARRAVEAALERGTPEPGGG